MKQLNQYTYISGLQYIDFIYTRFVNIGKISKTAVVVVEFRYYILDINRNFRRNAWITAQC